MLAGEMGCGASRIQGTVAASDAGGDEITAFEPQDTSAPIFVSDTGAGALSVSSSSRESLVLTEAMPPGTLESPQPSLVSASEGNADKGSSLILRHPPRKPQRLEEKQTLMSIRSPKHKLVSSAGRINLKSNIQDVPEEDEEADETEGRRTTTDGFA